MNKPLQHFLALSCLTTYYRTQALKENTRPKSTDFWLSTCLLLLFLSFRVRQRRGGEEEKEWGGHDFASHQLQRLPAKSTHIHSTLKLRNPTIQIVRCLVLVQASKDKKHVRVPKHTLRGIIGRGFPDVLRLAPPRLQSLPIIIHQPPARPSQAHAPPP